MTTGAITQILKKISAGEQQAWIELVPLVDKVINRIAAARMKNKNCGPTLNAADLVQEAFQKLYSQNRVQWKNRSQFFRTASKFMVWKLDEHARRRRNVAHFTTNMPIKTARPDSMSYADLKELLDIVERRYPEEVEMMWMRFIGFSVTMIAEHCGVGETTVRRGLATVNREVLIEFKKRN